tara:strand:- start:163 stop:864 length:702 start_codon:yes stop_codon:yes gene_type:complete
MSFFDYSDSVEYPIFLDECKSSEQLKKFRNTIDKHHQYMNSANIPSRRISFNMYETKSGNYIGGIGLASSVLALGGRDKYIGWDKETRLKNLGMTANNYRFCLIKDNITIKNVGTMALKLLRTVGAQTWEKKYGDRLVLIETFIKPPWNGSVYRADNWLDVGMTKGSSISKVPLTLWKREDSPRGKMARENPEKCLEMFAGYQGNKHYKVEKSEPKIIMLKPLTKKWKKILNG